MSLITLSILSFSFLSLDRVVTNIGTRVESAVGTTDISTILDLTI